MAATTINQVVPIACNDLALAASLGSSATLTAAATLASTAIVAGNTHEVVFPKNGKLLLSLANTFAGEKAFTIQNGDKIGNGDTVITLAQNQSVLVEPDASKHKNADGKCVVTVAASTTGNIMAIVVP